MALIEAVGVYGMVRDVGLQDCSTNKGAVGIFDPLNPTGQYTLDLGAPSDRELLNKLKQYAAEEADGEGADDRFLNPVINHLPITVGVMQWPVADGGILTLDFVSLKRIPRDAKPQR